MKRFFGYLFFISIAGYFILGCLFLIFFDGEKDLSHDFSRGHVVGKEYELLQDVYVVQYNNDHLLRMKRRLGKAYSYDKSGNKYEVNSYSKVVTIPKGTRFKVCKVFASTSFGSELCCQRVAASLSDIQGNAIPMTDLKGRPALVRVESLFKNTYGYPNENWVFESDTEWLKCINEGNS